MYSEDLKSRSDLSLEEIEKLLNDEKDVKVFKKLLYFKFKLLGFSKIDSCKYSGIKESSRYYLDDLWEKGGYNALVPDYGGGRNPKLSSKQLKKLKKLLEQKEKWLIVDVQDLIKDEFDIEYSYHGVRSLLLKLEIPIMTKYEKKKEENTKIENIVSNFKNKSSEETKDIEDIINRIKKEKSAFVLKKLVYLLFRSIGFDNKTTSSFLKISLSTGNNWSNQWQNGGYNELLRKPGQGRKSKLNNEQLDDLKKN